MARFGAIGDVDEGLELERIGAPGRPDRGNPKQHGFALPNGWAQERTFVCACLRGVFRTTPRSQKRSAFRRVHNLENTGTNRLFRARD
jgi:hypothetical protein